MNGVTERGSDRKDTFVVSASTNIKPNLQLLLQWRQDVNVENGLEISGLQSRFCMPSKSIMLNRLYRILQFNIQLGHQYRKYVQ
ncbi:hypothetical protein IDM32_04620 [Acinetobacter seifertii]|nr:hypothetical protein [Acinetobacter seifertii]